MNQIQSGYFNKQVDSWVDTGIALWMTFEPQRGIDQSLKREFGTQQEDYTVTYASCRYPMSAISFDPARHRIVDIRSGRIFNISVIANVDERNREIRFKLVELK